MSTPLFSVIVPAFNSEGHIRRLLDSVRSQSFRNYELVVVCDSCHDNTEQVAKEYGAVTESVSFGHDGLTRDRGVELATGKWILFADDDDWFIHANCFAELAKYISSVDDDVDVISFGIIDREQGLKLPQIDKIFTPRYAHVWESCWKRNAIGNVKFGDAVYCSDTYFLKGMRSNVRKCAVLEMPLYYYNHGREGSQTDLYRKGIIEPSLVAF